MKNILGILILPFGLMIIAIIYTGAQVKYFTNEVILICGRMEKIER